MRAGAFGRSVFFCSSVPLRRCCAHHRLGEVAAAHATQQRFDLGRHARHRQHILAGQQVHGQRRQALGGVGHRHRAVAQQFDVVERLVRRGQRVLRCDREDKGQIAQRLHRHPGRRALQADADGQVGLAADQRLPGAGQHLGAQLQPRARAAVAQHAAADAALRVQRIEGLAQLEHGQREITSSTATLSCVSQPEATR